MHTFQYKSYSCTDKGRSRHVNEDSYFSADEQSLWCVADGMGGHQKGQVASQLIVSTLKELSGFQANVSRKNIKENLDRVNQSLLNSEHASSTNKMGSTVAILTIENQTAHCIWAGDCRVYLYRANQLKCLTKDHSHVQKLLDEGVISQEECIQHPYSHIVTRAIGTKPELELDTISVDIMDEDMFILSSDGLHGVLDDYTLAHVARNNEKHNVAKQLVQSALSSLGNDNITALTVCCHTIDD